jgi:hypothetical protein
MDERVVENLLAAYAALDALVAGGGDPLAVGQVEHLLEFNRLVLCGTDADRRRHFSDHLQASERRFYEERDGGIGDLVETLALASGSTPWELAAVAYARMTCQPKLFIEGNHRTGALVISALLLRSGEPPFVLTAGNAAAFFAISEAFSHLPKNGLASFIRVPSMRRRLAAWLQAESRPEYLRYA